ncbi:MAG: hypothetical protein ACPGVU_04730 [Limisphaerales bacterium]
MKGTYVSLACAVVVALLGSACSDGRPGPPKLPKHVTEEYLVGKYASDIQALTRSLGSGEAIQGESLNADLLAVIARGQPRKAPPSDGGKDLLGRHQAKVQGSFAIRNGIGVAELMIDGIKEQAIIKQLGVNGTNYWYCFRDTH